MTQPMIGVIGGSGLYTMAGLEGGEWHAVSSPFGAPSDSILTGRLDGMAMAFLPRHGRGHVHSPSSVPYRANIDAFKRLGVTDVVSLGACGSLRQDMAPGDFVLVDQYIDATTARESSFFGPGCVAHVSLANPTCARLSATCADAAQASGIRVHRGGSYLAIEGPQFSTLAESRLYREVWGCDVIGMTGMPEARLAREAELCYASVAMITDYDSWHPHHGEVDVRAIIATLTRAALRAREMLRRLPAHLDAAAPGTRRRPCPQGCDQALEHAIVTAPHARDPALLHRLEAVAGRMLNNATK